MALSPQHHPEFRSLLATSLLGAAGAAAATTLTALPGAMAGGSVTGVYAVSAAVVGGKSRVTTALVCSGKVRELHTSNGSGGWLPRKSGSQPIKVSTSTVASLTAQAGGVDKDVATMSQSVKNAFQAACGGGTPGGTTPGAGGSSPPMQVEPIGKTGCPAGYQFNFTTKTCQLLSRNDADGLDVRLAARSPDWTARLFALVPLGSAHAFLKDIYRKINVTWRFQDVGSGFSYSYQPVDGVPAGYPEDTVGVIAVEGGGFSVQWLVSGS